MFFEERNCNSSNAMAQPLNFSRNLPDISFLRSLMPPDSVLGAQTKELAASIFLNLSTAAPTGPVSTLAPSRLLEPKSQHTAPVSMVPTFVPTGGDPSHSLARFFLPYDRRANNEVEGTQTAYEQAFMTKAVDRAQRQPYADYHLAAFQRALDHLALLGLSNNCQSPCSLNSMLPTACTSVTDAPIEISIQKTQCLPNNFENPSQSAAACHISTEPNVTTSCSHSERRGWQLRRDSTIVQSSSSSRSNIWTVAPEEAPADSEKIQNIADLAVEKHFEKALADFRSTTMDQRMPKSPLDLSCPVDSVIDVVSSPIEVENIEIQEGQNTGQGRSVVRPVILSNAARSFESGISASEASNSSPGSGCSYKPKKNWLAQYGWRKKGVSPDFPSCLSWDSGEWYAESGSSEKSAESLKETRSTRTDRRKSQKRDEAPVNSIANASGRSPTTAPPSCMQHQSLLHVRRQSPLRRRSETIKSDSVDCLLHKIPQSALTPDVSPTATSGFFTDSSFSLDRTLPTVSEDNLPTVACDAKDSEPSHSFARDCQHHRQRVIAQTYPSKYWTIRKRAASDANNCSCLKRSRSLAGKRMARGIPDHVDVEEVLNSHNENSKSGVVKITIT
ncbi:unnamed protein product [Schistocephalus solidus]|uniref:Uncharacterized protein n=1 Tax=Schistocephalus solidus TaxID=70667 RepID=A0A183SS90_SCHSO|nr:unnamed protein product [Schistocephalus solidus]